MNSGIPVIIAIDDQPAILHILIAGLKDLYSVKAFTSGKAALEFLKTRQADLILLDYDMPEMNGYEVLARLQSDDKASDIPVIFLTGSEDSDDEAEALNRGAADYIQKPINARVLRTRVKLQLELRRYQNHLESLVAQQTEHLRQANEKLKIRENVTLSLLAEVTDMRDHGTGSHIIRTTEMVRIIVAHLLQNPRPGYTISGDEAEDIVSSAKLHDLGKIAVPDRVLLKPDRLDDDEFIVIKKHPDHGAGLLDKYIPHNDSDPFLHTARDIALCHHEKWDGSGYPHGLRGENIPLPARITALADVYDALTSRRPYKEPFSHENAVKIMKDSRGTHFDPYLTDVFMMYENSFEMIAENFSG